MHRATLSPSAERLTAAAARVAATVAVIDTGCADDVLVELLREIAHVRASLEVIQAQVAAEVAQRSARDRGRNGMAQRMGHRTAVSLVQNLTGQSRADVTRALRAGDDVVARASDGPAADPSARADPGRNGNGSHEWRDVLTHAWTGGQVTQAQYAAIRRGLGEPPRDRYPDLDPDFLPSAWSVAARMLLDEASTLSVEDLGAAARIARDRLDPVGATLRSEERFAARSFRVWTDEHGQRHARIVFDDDAAAWVDTILNAALRPRRGPRFVDSGPGDTAGGDESSEFPGSTHSTEDANESREHVDERTNEQLQYDTLIAILRTGAAADPHQAFGDRQPGVRIMVEAAALINDRGETRVTGVGHLEDGGHSVPGSVVETHLCDAGTIPITLDTASGRPLDVGREHRLFTRKQRLAIAAREGGCVGPHCNAPMSHCEMHHVRHWWEDHGRTDVDDGVPLCRSCHLRLHNQRARISRQRDTGTGRDTYFWHPPPDPITGESPAAVPLRSRNPRRFDRAPAHHPTRAA